jgi:4-methyl-5(b-hydroxyethyl)-thiazole monophosphate biosynthesis
VAKYGYLEGKNAVCYPSMEDELYGANRVDAPVVRDGKIITARAAGASEEFAFELIRALTSKEAAEKVRHAICAR